MDLSNAIRLRCMNGAEDEMYAEEYTDDNEIRIDLCPYSGVDKYDAENNGLKYKNGLRLVWSSRNSLSPSMSSTADSEPLWIGATNAVVVVKDWAVYPEPSHRRKTRSMSDLIRTSSLMPPQEVHDDDTVGMEVDLGNNEMEDGLNDVVESLLELRNLVKRQK
jgi:hypothetical protein